MILENQGATTRDRYICKFVEYILFDSEKSELSSLEICTRIKNRFQLEFDLTEIESAVKKRGRGRLEEAQGYYRLMPKVANQLSSQKSSLDQLRNYLTLFSQERQNVDIDATLMLVQKYLYFCFNSNVSNLLSLIGENTKHIDGNAFTTEFTPSQEEIDIINDFIHYNKFAVGHFLRLKRCLNQFMLICVSKIWKCIIFLLAVALGASFRQRTAFIANKTNQK